MTYISCVVRVTVFIVNILTEDYSLIQYIVVLTIVSTSLLIHKLLFAQLSSSFVLLHICVFTRAFEYCNFARFHRNLYIILFHDISRVLVICLQFSHV